MAPRGPIPAELRLFHAMRQYDRGRGKPPVLLANLKRSESLRMRCLRLANGVTDFTFKKHSGQGEYGRKTLLQIAFDFKAHNDVCLVLIGKGIYASVGDALLANRTHVVLEAMMLWTGDEKIAIDSYPFLQLFKCPQRTFDSVAKWGRIGDAGVVNSPHDFALRLRQDRRSYNSGNAYPENVLFTEQGTPHDFPRLRLLRLIPDYDNFVNVICNWRRTTKYSIPGIERLVWTYLYNSKF